MPEGDTLRRAAELLTPILEGRTVTELWFRKLRGYRPRIGDRIHRVDAVGKYLLIEFDRGLMLHTHLGMAGSWRVTPNAQPLPRTPKLRVVIGTDAGRALCFSAPEIATHLVGSADSPTGRIGPDLSDDDVDVGEIVRRSRERADADTTLAALLLDQAVAAGVGNVFKSEALFITGLHPFTTVDEVDDSALARLWTNAHRQLVANRSRPYRMTTRPGDGGRTYVYGRRRLGCRRCDNAIEFSPAGERTERSTYWCPSCQPAA